MQFMGSKHQVRRPLVAFLESVRNDRPLYEPFCGSLAITSTVVGKRFASDNDASLITLYKAIQAGWVPPAQVTREQYNAVAAVRNPENPLTAFIGYGCSFGGKFFGGYAQRNSNNWGLERRESDGAESYYWGWNAEDIRRWVARAPTGVTRELLTKNDPRVLCRKPPPRAEFYYAEKAKRALLAKMAACKDVEFRRCDYQDVAVEGALLYCDPPYAGTTDYGNQVDVFNTDAFWNWCRRMALRNVVVVSEYQAPDDFECVLEMPTASTLRGNGSHTPRVERLFMRRGGLR